VADLSHRELAERIATPKSTVAAAESGVGGLDARRLATAAALAGMQLAVVDADGRPVPGMGSEAVRDLAGRLFPAHLDPRPTTEEWWEGTYRRGRREPWYTFDRDRQHRSDRRAREGTPGDHRTPRPGDSPTERRAARIRAARQRREEDSQRRRAAGLVVPAPEFECACPPECDELDDRSGPPVHADLCPCRCDVA
jgi:HTH-type transcriptional regulator/antitoxin HipB